MDEKTMKPEIRFKGFTEAWEQRKLSSLGKIETGNTPSTSISEYYSDDGLLWVTPTDIKSNITLDTERKLSSTGVKVARVIPKNSILCTCIASIGKNTFLPVKCAFNQQINALSSNDDNDPYFLYTNSYHWSETMKKNAGGLTFQIVNKTEFSNIETIIPKKTEQIQIGLLFKELDDVITLHQRKYEKLQSIKKGLLEKMFPADGALTPSIRFKGFTEAWEQRKVNEISSRFDNLRVPVAESLRIEGNTPYYGANGIQDYVEGFTHEGEFVLVAEDGANDLKNYPVQYVNGRIWVNNHAHVLQSNTNNETLFLKYLINSTNIESLLVGGGRAKLNAEVLMNIDLIVPDKKEQKNISFLLSKVEELITLHQRKCEKLQNIKKALLQKMFC